MIGVILARRRMAAVGTATLLMVGSLFAAAAGPVAAAAQSCPGMMVTLSKADDVDYGFGVDDDVLITLNGTVLLDNNDELATVISPLTFSVHADDQLRIIASNSTIYGGNAFIESLALFCTSNSNVQVLEPNATSYVSGIGFGEVFFDRTYTIDFTDVTLFDFDGFEQPVDNLPTINVMKAGAAAPVKFSLHGDQGLAIFDGGYPKSQTITCTSSADVAGVEETVSAGGSSLTYDASTDLYTYVWKTDKSWAGTCRQLVLKLTDGTYHRANFQFK